MGEVGEGEGLCVKGGVHVGLTLVREQEREKEDEEEEKDEEE